MQSRGMGTRAAFAALAVLALGAAAARPAQAQVGSFVVGAGATYKPAGLPVGYACRADLFIGGLAFPGLACGPALILDPPAEDTVEVDVHAGVAGVPLEVACTAEVTTNPLGLEPTGCGPRLAPLIPGTPPVVSGTGAGTASEEPAPLPVESMPLPVESMPLPLEQAPLPLSLEQARPKAPADVSAAAEAIAAGLRDASAQLDEAVAQLALGNTPVTSP